MKYNTKFLISNMHSIQYSIQGCAFHRDMHANECNEVFIIHYHNSVVSPFTQSTKELAVRMHLF